MRLLIAIGILLTAILLFGCIGSSNTESEKSSTENGETSDTGGTADTSGTSGTSESGRSGIGGFNMEVAQKCVVKDKKSGATIIYYLDGKGNMRMETSYQGVNMITIVKDKVAYVKTTEDMKESLFKGCDWLSQSAENKNKISGAQGDIDVDLKAMSEAVSLYEITCTPQAFDNSLLATSGEVCDMDKIIEEATKNPCASLTDPEQRAACEQAMANQ